MSPEHDLTSLFRACRAALVPGSPGMTYLGSRGYSPEKVIPLGIGYYRGDTGLPIEHKPLSGFLWKWGDGTPAIVYPLRSLGGSLLGLQFGALAPGKYETFYLPEATTRGTFFYPDTVSIQSIYDIRAVCLGEGSLDTIALQTYLKAALGCGTAKATPAQVRSLYRLCDFVYCAFDGDEAGDRGAKKLELEKNGFRVIRVRPSIKDPQLLHEKGALSSWVRGWAAGSKLLR